MFDISVNLTNKQFKKDLDTVISRAFINGINGILIIGSSIVDSYNAYKLTKKYKNYCWSTVGIHPHYAFLCKKNTIIQIEKFFTKKNIVAIGECGLDFYRNYSSKKEQLLAFSLQLELASYYSIPLFLHCRNAFITFFKILKFWIHKLPKIIIHCFSGDINELKQCLDMNMYIGLTESFFNKKYRYGSINDIKLIPHDKLLIGTDSPFLLFKHTYPILFKKFKGRNEPSLLPNLLKKISVIRNEDYINLDIQTEKNTFNILNLNKNN